MRPYSVVAVLVLSSACSLIPKAKPPATATVSALQQPSDDEVRRLRDYSAELLRELEQTRADSAKSREEMQQVLDETTQRLRDELAKRQASYAEETVRREKEVNETRGALDASKAEEARHAARAAELEKTVADLKRSIERHDAERKTLEGQVAAAQQAKQDAAKTQAATLADREKQLADLGARLADSERERERRAKDLETQQSRLAEARDQLGALQNERKQATAKVADLDAEIRTLKKTAATQDETKQKLERELADLMKARDQQAETDGAALAERNEKIDGLIRQISDTEREGRERDQKLRQQAEELEVTRDQIVAAAAADKVQSEQTLAAQAADLATLRDNFERTQVLGAERLRQLDVRAKELDAARQLLQTLQHDTETRKQKTEALQKQVRELRTKASKREAEQKSRQERDQAQIAELSSRAAKLESELESFRAAREASAGEAQRVEQEQSTVSAKLARLAQRSDTEALANSVELKKRLGQLKKEGRQLDASQRDQQDRIEKLESEIRQVKQTSRSRLEALESVLENTRSAGASLRTQLDAERARNVELSQHVTGLKGSVHKVHDLQTSLQQTKLRIEEIGHEAGDETGELRVLRAREASLEAELREAQSSRRSTTDSVNVLVKMASAFERVSEGAEAPDDPQSGDVREQLSIERERRQTLEQEVQRLTSTGNNEERYVELWKTLQSARSEILVLSNQLADERKSREDFELSLAKLKEQSGGNENSSGEFAQRLADTLKERRAQADLLGAELKNANEVIVRLKGRLEASGSPLAENKILADLDRENQSLRAALAAAETAKKSLQDKADMAEQLAEMVYGKAP